MPTNNNALPKTVKFTGGNGASFSNALHVQFHRKQFELVKASNLSKLNLSPDLMGEWSKNIALEVEINKETTVSVFTERMKKKDEERDALLSNIFGVVRAQKLSPLQAVREAAEVLDATLKPYVGIQNDAYEVESAHIAGLEVDVAKHADELNALGLAAVVAQLHTVNEEYEKLRTGRRADELSSKLTNAKEVRPQTDAAFETVCQYIQGSYLFAKTDDDRAMIKKLVDGMNQISADFKVSHNESRAQKKKNPRTPPGKDGKGDGDKKDTDKTRAEYEKNIAPLVPQFEQLLKLPAGSLSFTGKTKKIIGNLLYEFAVKDSAKTVWGRVEGDHLIEVMIG